MATELRGWQAVQDEVLHRIQTRQWKPGEPIPNEADLAKAFGCSRSTINRALQALADTGLLDRRRKVGTRVALHPVRKATLTIPIIRQEVEGRGHAYGYALISRKQRMPPSSIRGRMCLRSKVSILHVMALHLADGTPYVLEDRWINIEAAPAIIDLDLEQQSANEWLVTHAPISHGDITISATSATKQEAQCLNTSPNEALFVIERLTWNSDVAITSVRLTFAPGYRIQTAI